MTNKTLDIKTKTRRLELELDDSLIEAKNGYPEFTFLQDGLTKYDPNEDLVLEEDTDLTEKIKGRNGNGTSYSHLPGSKTERFLSLKRSIEKRKLEQAKTVILDKYSNIILQ